MRSVSEADCVPGELHSHITLLARPFIEAKDQCVVVFRFLQGRYDDVVSFSLQKGMFSR